MQAALKILATIALAVHANVAFNKMQQMDQLLLLLVVLGSGLLFVPNFMPTALRLIATSRWILLITLIAAAWATPGTEFFIGATKEGLEFALLSVIHVTSLLATASLLLASTSQEDILNGLRLLLLPLKIFSISPEKCAARIGLALMMCKARKNSFRILKEFPDDRTLVQLVEQGAGCRQIVWQRASLSIPDCFGLLLVVLSFL